MVKPQLNAARAVLVLKDGQEPPVWSQRPWGTEVSGGSLLQPRADGRRLALSRESVEP